MKLVALSFFFSLFASMAHSYWGACTDSDKAIFGHNNNFLELWQNCGRNSRGDSASTMHCISRSFPELSRPCLSCFGNFTACGAHHCRRECFWDSRSSHCIECGLNNCAVDWEQCSGASRELIIEHPAQWPL